jgi:succinate dehydrogenase / fumarate reductase iron-sulfur subunit
MTDIRNITLSIYRYIPEENAQPFMQDYSLEVTGKSDVMLLSLLERIKTEQDPTLSFRRSCREEYAALMG